MNVVFICVDHFYVNVDHEIIFISMVVAMMRSYVLVTVVVIFSVTIIRVY